MLTKQENEKDQVTLLGLDGYNNKLSNFFDIKNEIFKNNQVDI